VLKKPKSVQVFNEKILENENTIESTEERLPIAPIASYLQLKRKIQNSNSFDDQEKLTQQLKEMEKEQAEIKQKVDLIFNSVVGKNFNLLSQNLQKPPQMITQIDCHHNVVKMMSRECKQILKSPFVNEFVTPFVNLCELKFDAQKIIAQLHKHCAN